MAKDLKCSVDELIANKELRQKIKISGLHQLVWACSRHTSQELDATRAKAIKVFEFDKNVGTIADLREGMIASIVAGNNITNFGCRYRHQGERGCAGRNRYISDPTEIVSIHQHVMVRVMNVDTDRKRIQLSMIGVQQD